MTAQLTDEGRIEVERGFTIAYRVFGSGSRTLLALHGGPGASSRYLGVPALILCGYYDELSPTRL